MANSNKTDAEKKVDGEIGKIDLYGLLEVDPDAIKKNIVKAYRKKALKCHPDKNPDNPKAAEMFHQLSVALEILTDVAARTAYDKILKAKKASEARHKVLDSQRKKFKEDLEAREKRAQEERERGPVIPDLTQAERLQKEIDRLRKEGSRMLEEEQEKLRQEIQAEKARGVQPESNEPPRLKLKWQAAKTDPKNGSYSYDSLYKLLDKYGEIAALLVSTKKLGSAIVEFCQPTAAVLAFDNEHGLATNPLKISWISGKPKFVENSNPGEIFKAPNVDSNVLSGFSFSTDGNVTSASQGIQKETNDSSNGATFVKSKWDDPQNFGSNAATDDFESLVLRNMRQAQERKRLEQEMLNEEET